MDVRTSYEKVISLLQLTSPIPYGTCTFVPYHFEKNYTLDDKLAFFAPLFMNDLVKRLKQLTLNNNKYFIHRPKEIAASLEKFFKSRCIFVAYKFDRLIKSPGTKLFVDTAFNNFRNYTDEYNQKYSRDKNTFEAEMTRVLEETPKKGGNKGKKYWLNYDLISIEDIEENDE